MSLRRRPTHLQSSQFYVICISITNLKKNCKENMFTCIKRKNKRNVSQKIGFGGKREQGNGAPDRPGANAGRSVISGGALREE